MKESNLQVLRIVPADQTGPETAEEGGGEMKADPTKADVKVCLMSVHHFLLLLFLINCHRIFFKDHC